MRQMDERAADLGIAGRSSANDEADASESRFPPAAPALEEEALSASDDPVVEHCLALAEWQSIAADSRVLRVLITRSPEWGVIWRADIADPNQSTTRLTCTRSTTASRPLDVGDDRLAPLPDGGPLPAHSE